VLGTNNQLTRLTNPVRADLSFEYDTTGRPTRRVLGDNDVSYTYDPLGRITEVYEGERKILEWRYGPMDVDAATEADDHTPWTAVNEPIASGTFGSLESVAYARTRGTPFGPI
jgi:YD repeat-containing protein